METTFDIPDWLLACLRCPITGEPLVLATEDTFAVLRTQHSHGSLRNKMGRTISSVPTQGLVNASNRWFYEYTGTSFRILADEAIAFEDDSRVRVR